MWQLSGWSERMEYDFVKEYQRFNQSNTLHPPRMKYGVFILFVKPCYVEPWCSAFHSVIYNFGPSLTSDIRR